MELTKEQMTEFLKWAEIEMEKACTTQDIGLACFPNSLIRHTLRLDFGIEPKHAPEYWDWLKSSQGKQLKRSVNRILKKYGYKMNSGGGIIDPRPPKGAFEL
jgi:hypothetical protein